MRAMRTTPMQTKWRETVTLSPPLSEAGRVSCSCLLIILGIQLWSTDQPAQTTAATAEDIYTEPSLTLGELIIEENLNAAAEDPSIYTRDEIVAMIGF